MKKIKTFLASLLFYIHYAFNYKKIKAEQATNDALDEALSILSEEHHAKTDAQRKLIAEIKDFMRKKYGYLYGSKYIPEHSKNNAEIYLSIHREFGQKMSKNRVQLNEKLIISCT